MSNLPIPGPGRNSLLTPELQEKLCAKLRKTLPADKACALVGIDEKTYYNWVARGKKAAVGDEKYVAFLQAVTTAHAEAQEFWIDIMANSAVDKGTNPKAAFWVLERSDRKNWGRVDRVEVDQIIMTPESLTDALKAIETNDEDDEVD
jgi:hypothetical protein